MALSPAPRCLDDPKGRIDGLVAFDFGDQLLPCGGMARIFRQIEARGKAVRLKPLGRQRGRGRSSGVSGFQVANAPSGHSSCPSLFWAHRGFVYGDGSGAPGALAGRRTQCLL